MYNRLDSVAQLLSDMAFRHMCNEMELRALQKLNKLINIGSQYT